MGHNISQASLGTGGNNVEHSVELAASPGALLRPNDVPCIDFKPRYLKLRARRELVHVHEVEERLRGRNGCLRIRDAQGNRFVFKHNTGGRFAFLLDTRERNRRDANNVIASRILRDVFCLPAMLYHQATLRFPSGQALSGVISEYVENLRPLEHVTPEKILNKDELLAQSIVLCWFGDIDRITNIDNDVVDSSGIYRSLDFDFCFYKGVSSLGLPNISRVIVQRFLAAAATKPYLDYITNLSDVEIRTIVEHIGREWVVDWNEAESSRISSILIYNRTKIQFLSRQIHLGHLSNRSKFASARATGKFLQYL